MIPIVVRNEYQTALRDLSREGRCDLYVRTLAHAGRWTAAMPWQGHKAVNGQLMGTNALTDSTDVERHGCSAAGAITRPPRLWTSAE